MFVLDPICEVVQPGIKEQNVTLKCRMTYEWQARARQFNVPPIVEVALSWTGVSGSTVRTIADPSTFSGTLETSATINNDPTSGTTRPSSHDCTIVFNFLAGLGPLYQYAVNPVSYTCVATPACK